MGKLKYLSKNIMLFSISNFVSKILVFLLVPFYTNVLSTYEYGVADVIQVTLLLLVPMITVNVGEAALRFGIEETDKRNSIFKVGIKYIVRASIIVCFICFALRGAAPMLPIIAGRADEIKLYLLLSIFLFAANAFYEFLVLFFQGCEEVETIVIGSITCTMTTIGFNLIFLLGLKIGLRGYIYSQILAFALSGILMLLIGKKNGLVLQAVIDSDIEERMLAYSKPMIVYSTAAWVNNAVDRYFVLYMCGAAVNGVYGVAYKIPAILMVFQRIFAQAWQLSATKVHKDEDSDEFYSDMYKAYNCFMVLGCAVLILLLKPVAAFLFRKDFFVAWKLVSPLLISVVFGALTGFLGSICLAHKDSKSMGRATAIGALINVILNLIMIPVLSSMGAALATGISYFVMFALALYFVKKHVKLEAPYIINICTYVLLVIEAVIMIKEVKYSYFICAVICVLILFAYVKELKRIIEILISKIKR